MKATKEMIEKYRKWYFSQGHSFTSTLEYYNNIKRYVGDGKEVSQRTVDSFRENAKRTTTSGALKSFFYFLTRYYDFPQDILNIRFDRNKQTKKFPKSISVKEVQIIINNMPSLKYKIMTVFIFELGLRISEALKIKWEDFNWSEWLDNKEEYGKVNIKNTKRNKFRVLPVKPELMNLIYNVTKNRTEEGIPIGHIVFDFGIEGYILYRKGDKEKNIYLYLHNASCQYRNLIYKISKEKLNKRISPHQLRHSKAQMLMDNDMPIESLKVFLGHEKISSTEIYAQASPEKVKRDLKAFDIFKNTQLQ
jgi:integrase/recombinase XerD